MTAAVLSPEESELIFGRPLTEKGIQTVWLEINNGEEVPYYLISPSDPTYISASEAAYMNRVSSEKANKQMANDYRKLTIEPRLAPGKTESGFVFMSIDHSAKVVSVVFFDPHNASGQVACFLFLDARSESRP